MNQEPLGIRVSTALAPRSTRHFYDILTAETYCAEENAFKVLMNPQEEENKNNGLLIIMAAYEQHKDNGEVVENIVGLLKELVNYSKSFSATEYTCYSSTLLYA